MSEIGAVVNDIHAHGPIVDALALAQTVREERYLARIQDAGITTVFATAATPDSSGDDLQATLRQFDGWYRWAAERHDVRIASSVHELEESRAAKQLGVVLLLQDPRPIGEDLALLRILYRLGLRVLQVAYNSAGPLGTGCAERNDGGLTFFGLEALAQMEELGILVDVSHCGDRTTWDVISAARRPVVCTHANARALCPNPRNKTDDQLRAIKDTGGVIGVSIYTPFVKRTDPTTLTDVVAHIDHLVNLLGPQHVGLGLDSNEMLLEQPETRQAFPLSRRWRERQPNIFGKWGEYRPQPEGIQHVGLLPNLTAALLSQGYPLESVAAILGKNWLRVAREVWGE